MAAQEQEDMIDLQDIQAQIDLSMSFAQNLVTSWVQPTHFSKSGRQRDLESEIKEYMRRPARLGVGAPIPETQSLAREAARLKTKLEGGKKRQRESKDAESTTLPSDDEGESRASAIKKKARQDPFDFVSKKGKAKGGPTAQTNSLTIHTISESQPVAAVGKAPHSAPAPKSSNLSSGTDNRMPSPTSKLSDISFHPPTPPTPSLVPTQPTKLDVSPTAKPLLSPGHHAEFLKQPLLNLGGSPEEETGDSLPKKKRRRRKKKKLSQDVVIPSTERQ